MRAKHHEQSEARRLRAEGLSLKEIAEQLGVAKSSVSLWVRDLPRIALPRIRSEQTRLASEARWEPVRRAHEERREVARARARAEVGRLSPRELLLVGAALYWAEGSKSKPCRRSQRVVFVNSDPNVIAVFLGWLHLVGVERERIGLRVSIHESADVQAAQEFWADVAGVAPGGLRPPSLKRHNPRTVRRNVGEGYRGCLVVDVRRGAELYRRIEGWWYGIVGGARPA